MLKPLILEPNHPWSFMHLAKTYPDDIALGHIFQSKRFRVGELAENLLVHSSNNQKRDGIKCFYFTIVLQIIFICQLLSLVVCIASMITWKS